MFLVNTGLYAAALYVKYSICLVGHQYPSTLVSSKNASKHSQTLTFVPFRSDRFFPFLSRLVLKKIPKGAERCHCFDRRQVSGGYVHPGFREISWAGVPQGRRNVLPGCWLHGQNQVRGRHRERGKKRTGQKERKLTARRQRNKTELDKKDRKREKQKKRENRLNYWNKQQRKEPNERKRQFGRKGWVCT